MIYVEIGKSRKIPTFDLLVYFMINPLIFNRSFVYTLSSLDEQNSNCLLITFDTLKSVFLTFGLGTMSQGYKDKIFKIAILLIQGLHLFFYYIINSCLYVIIIRALILKLLACILNSSRNQLVEIDFSIMKFGIILVINFVSAYSASQKCNQIKLSSDKTICVCNSAYCDDVPHLEKLGTGDFQHFSTSLQNFGLNSVTEHSTVKNPDVTIQIDKTRQHQTIIGFGGAFTDSTGQVIKTLPEKAQQKLLEAYFGERGIEYSLGRVPIGGTDFSPRAYSYDDHPGDVNLEKFALQPEDLDYKTPIIKQAIELRNGKQLKLFGSPWTSPKWTKTNNDWTGKGELKREYYQYWADYFVKFFENYQKHNISFWGLTTQNEPFDGFLPKLVSKLNALGWTPSTEAKWIKNNLGPSIRNSSFKDLKILVHDDNRMVLPLLSLLLNDDEALKYIDGVGVHWYADKLFPWSFLKFAKTPKKDLLLLGTEACNGFLNAFGLEEAVSLGNWERGVNYVNSIIQNLNYDANGWVDWNMVLNTSGGPVYIKNQVDAPIVVNTTSGEFYKQPMYYAMGHFSKFVIPGSVRLDVKVDYDFKLMSVAFLRPDNLTSVFVSNQRSKNTSLQITDGDKKFTVVLEGKSFNTIIYK